MNIFAFSSCGSTNTDDKEIELYEPSYQGLAENEKPMYLISWSLVPGTEKYEVMIHTSMDGFEGNTSRYVYNKMPQISLVFLQGVYTDTVNYRIKVRAFDKNGKAQEWSNVWEMNYVDGKCTLTDNAADFQDTEEAPYIEEVPNVENENDEKTETLTPLEHNLPESLATYVTRENGLENTDLSECTIIETRVLRCEYSEPEQIIAEPEVVKKIIDAVSDITVEGIHDEIYSTEDSFIISFYNDVKFMGSAEIQNNFLVCNGKRYSLTNLDELLKIDEIMLFDEWDKFWDNLIKAEDEYTQNYELTLPANVLEKGDYIANTLYNNLDNAVVFYIYPTVVTTQKLDSEIIYDDTELTDIMAKINDLRAIELFDGDISNCQDWKLTISFTLEDGEYQPEVDLSFKGDNIILPDGNAYVCTGIEELLEAIDTPAADYLLENRNHRPVNPVF